MADFQTRFSDPQLQDYRAGRASATVHNDPSAKALPSSWLAAD
jgi:hypothetical protein